MANIVAAVILAIVSHVNKTCSAIVKLVATMFSGRFVILANSVGDEVLNFIVPILYSEKPSLHNTGNGVATTNVSSILVSAGIILKF